MSENFSYGLRPSRRNTKRQIEVKILNALNAGEGGGGVNGSTVYVDPNGSDSTGTRGMPSRPFLTLTAAKNAAQSGDTIFVNPGTYTENDLLKNGVNWHFYAGATVTYTENHAGGAGLGIFDDRNGAVTSTITGDGDFNYISIADGTGLGNEIGLFFISNSASVIRFKARDLYITGSASSDTGILALFTVVNCAYVNIEVDRVTDTTPGLNIGICMWWMYGETYFHAKQIGLFGLWTIWAAESYLLDPSFTPAITQPIIPLAAFNLWATWDDNAGSNYVQMESINMATWFNFKRVSTTGNVGFEIDCTGGKVYIVGEKIQASQCIQLSKVNGTHNNDLNVWVNVQKLSSNSRWLNLVGGSLVAVIDQFEDLGIGANNGIDVSSTLGDYRITCPKLTMKAGSTAKPINYAPSGTTTMRLHMDIDASNTTQPAITVAGAGLIIDNCKLITSGAVNCVSSAAAQTIKNYGSHANNAKNANITVQVDAIIVDANVQ